MTFVVYLPALQNEFVNWDDGLYVYDNFNIRSIDFHVLKWVFTLGANPTWHPLTLLSLALDYAVWGLNPLGYHLTNNILHAINTSLVFILSIKLMGYANPVIGKKDYYPFFVGAITALLFGIHPLHVESVAWISERKDVLCGFFFLTTLLAYIRYAAANSKRPYYYGLCLILFVLALLSKPMAVSLPVVLLILDFYPLQRLMIGDRLRNVKAMFIEKLPFFLLSLVSSIITVIAQRAGEALQSFDVYPLKMRIFDSIRAFGFYLIKMVFPFNLAPFYPHTMELNFFTVDYLGSFVLLIATTVLSIRSLKRNRLFFSVWLYYVVTLIPVIGIIKVGGHVMADRYTYLPSIGPFLLAGIGVGAFIERCKKRQYQMSLVILILFSGIMISRTIEQMSIWRSSVMLWSHQIKIYIDRDVSAYLKRGDAYQIIGKYQPAITDYNKAIELNYGFTDAYFHRGNAYAALGNLEQAIKDYEKAIDIDPKNADAYYNLGNIYANLKDYQRAILNFNFAVKLNPKYTEAYNNRGMAYDNIGNHKRAIDDFDMAIKLNPEHAKAYSNKGIAYSILGDAKEAIISFNKAIELNPQNATGFYNRGLTYYSSGDLSQAIVDFNKATALNPKYAEAYYFLGSAYSKTGDAERAISNYKKAASLGLKEAESGLSAVPDKIGKK